MSPSFRSLCSSGWVLQRQTARPRMDVIPSPLQLAVSLLFPSYGTPSAPSYRSNHQNMYVCGCVNPAPESARGFICSSFWLAIKTIPKCWFGTFQHRAAVTHHDTTIILPCAPHHRLLLALFICSIPHTFHSPSIIVPPSGGVIVIIMIIIIAGC